MTSGCWQPRRGVIAAARGCGALGQASSSAPRRRFLLRHEQDDGRPPAVEGGDYDAPRLAWLWKSNVERTLKLATDNQLGVNSRHFEPGPYGNHETGLDRFAAWYLGRLA